MQPRAGPAAGRVRGRSRLETQLPRHTFLGGTKVDEGQGQKMETNGETKRSQKNSAGEQRRTGKLAGFEIPGQAVFDVVRCLGASVRAANYIHLVCRRCSRERPGNKHFQREQEQELAALGDKQPQVAAGSCGCQETNGKISHTGGEGRAGGQALIRMEHAGGVFIAQGCDGGEEGVNGVRERS